MIFSLEQVSEVVCSTDTISEIGAFLQILSCKNFLVINKD